MPMESSWNKNSMKLKEGEIYTLIRIREGRRGGKRIIIKEKERVRLVKQYRWHAQFENQKGIRRSYTYWELGKLLAGEKMEY